jgi:beta-lactamase class A
MTRSSRRFAFTPVARCRQFAAVMLAVLLASGSVLAQATSSVGNDPGLKRLERDIARLEALSGGTMGVAAIHLESGREVYLRKGERFPMASTFKVPVAVEVLARVDRGEIRLDSMITLQPGDLHPGSGTLTSLFNKPGVALSLRNVLELMLLISDNTAADISLRTARGGAAVTRKMHELGVDGIRVDRPTVRLIGDWIGVKNLPGDDTPPDQFRVLSAAVTPEQRKAAADAFDVDPRDTSTPEAMATLLRKIWRKEALSPASSDLLLDIMRRCQTGQARIRGMLPPETEVMHKTGTIGGTTDDVGIVTLPDNAGHIVLAVFVKASKTPGDPSEKAIAQVARAVYDYFLYNPGSGSASARAGN